MFNLRTISPKIIKLGPKPSSEEIMKTLFTIGNTVIFQDTKGTVNKQILIEYDFITCSKAIKYFYKVIDKQILLIALDKNLIYIKIWLPLNQRNLDVCKSGIESSFWEAMGRDYENIESNPDRPFFEWVLGRNAKFEPKILYRFKLINNQVYDVHYDPSRKTYNISPNFYEKHWPFVLKKIVFDKNGKLIDGNFYLKRDPDKYYTVKDNNFLLNHTEYKLTMDNFYTYWDGFTRKQIKEFKILVEEYNYNSF